MLLVCAVAACSSAATEPDSGSSTAAAPKAVPSPTVERAKGTAVPLAKPGRLTICRWAGALPFISATNADRVQGFDIEMLTRAGERLGVPPVVVDPVSGTDILANESLNRKYCDLTAGSFSAVEDYPGGPRVEYTDPYYGSTYAILSTDPSLTSLESLRDKKVATPVDYTVPDEVAAARILTVPLPPEMIPAQIANGEIDAGRNGHYRYAYAQWFTGEPPFVPGE